MGQKLDSNKWSWWVISICGQMRRWNTSCIPLQTGTGWTANRGRRDSTWGNCDPADSTRGRKITSHYVPRHTWASAPTLNKHFLCFQKLGNLLQAMQETPWSGRLPLSLALLSYTSTQAEPVSVQFYPSSSLVRKDTIFTQTRILSCNQKCNHVEFFFFWEEPHQWCNSQYLLELVGLGTRYGTSAYQASAQAFELSPQPIL